MLATLDDLRAIGALAEGVAWDHPDALRAVRLLELAEAQCLSHLRRTAVEVSAWPDADRLTLTMIVAELAARRITVSAAKATNQYSDGSPHPYVNGMLSRGDRRALDRIPAAGRLGVRSFEVTRPDSWTSAPRISTTVPIDLDLDGGDA